MKQQKAVFISGCDSGFGKRLVEKLEALDEFLVFAGVFTEEGKQQYEGKKKVIAVPLDVTSDVSVKNALDITKQELSSRDSILWAVVNNAGILTRPSPTEWQDVSNYERMMSVNLYGVVRLTNAFLPEIRQNKGRIVIVSSIASRFGLALNAAYCSSKYAVSGYGEVLRREMVPWGVTVSLIEPGIFSQTGLYGDFQKGLDSTWRGLDESLKNDYGEKYYKFTRKVLGMVFTSLSNKDPDQVPAAIIDALMSKNPRRRYRVGKDSNTIFRLFPLLPDEFTDTFMMRGTKNAVYPKKSLGTSELDLYAKDWTSLSVATGLVSLSSIGLVSIGKVLFSRL